MGPVEHNLTSFNDISALKQLYISTGGNNWIWKGAYWNFSAVAPNPCGGWQGITCDSNSRVIKISLSGVKMGGTLPPHLGNITLLQQLSLSKNKLFGEIPKTISSLVSLQSLDLSGNLFQTTLPSQIGDLSSLTNLNINTNKFFGLLPNTMDRLINLKLIDISLNAFTGTLPSSIYTLKYLSMYENKIRGVIPSSIGLRTKLIYLGLYSNVLTGTIPSELGALSLMQYFRTFNNSLTGRIPASLAGMTGSIIIRVNNNSHTGPMPSISNMPNLLYLDFQFNRHTGTLPPLYSNLTSLQYLYVHNNHIHGTIPSEYGLLKNIKYIRLNDNSLTGTLPSSFTLLKNLQVLLVQRNKLFGSPVQAFDETKQFNIQNIDLSENGFSGSLPSNIFLLNGIKTFGATQNCFVGSIPHTICSANSMQILSLNGLRGGSGCLVSIPLFYLTADVSKTIVGDVPECIWNLGNLTTLSMSGNGLTGQLYTPSIYSKLRSVSLSSNQLIGTIPISFQKWPFSNLDLSNNKITGTWSEVPQNYQTNTTVLRLNINRISGAMPIEFREARNIEVLSGNTFSCSDGLPIYDPRYNSYVCGSSNLDNSLYVFAGSIFVSIVFFLLTILIWRIKPDPNSNNSKSTFSFHDLGFIHTFKELYLWYSKTGDHIKSLGQENIPALYEFYTIISEMRKITFITICVILLICLPVYPALKLYIDNGSSSTIDYQYNWRVSIVFMSGIGPAIVLVILWNIVVMVFVYYLYNAAKKHKYSSLFLSRTRRSMSHNPRLAAIVAAKVRESVNLVMRISRNFIAVFIFFVNLIAIFIENGIFIRVQQSDYPSSWKTGAQFLKAFADTLWLYFITDLISRLFKNRATFIWYRILIFLTNNVVAPFVVSMAIADTCFKEVFVPATSVQTSYNFVACLFFSFNIDTSQLSCTQFGQLGPIESSYTPSFIYNNGCSSSILTTYIPVYIYTYSISAFIAPFLRFIWPSCMDMRYFPEFVRINALMGLLWPKHAEEVRSYLFFADYFVIDLLGDITLLLTFGLASPPLAVCISANIIINAIIIQVLIGRYLHIISMKFQPPTTNTVTESSNVIPYEKDDREMSISVPQHENDHTGGLEEACADCFGGLLQCLFMIILSTALFQGIVLLDIVDDGKSIENSFWPSLVVIIIAVVWRVVRLCWRASNEHNKEQKPIPNKVFIDAVST
eukprot:gene8141-16732_t